MRSNLQIVGDHYAASTRGGLDGMLKDLASDAHCRTTGKPMQARVAHVLQLARGKIVRFEQFTDTLLVAQAMQ